MQTLRRIAFLLLFQMMIACIPVWAQKSVDCPKCTRYQKFMKEGHRLKQNPDSLVNALTEFQAAQVAARECACTTDEPGIYIKKIATELQEQRNDAIKDKEKLEKTLNQAKINAANYLTSEAQKFFEKEDTRLAWYLTEAALRNNPKNERAKQLRQLLSRYGAEHLLEGQEERLSPDSSHLSFVSRNINEGALLHVWALQGHSYRHTFENIDPEHWNYSPEGKHLIFFTNVDALTNKGMLHVLELGKEYKEDTFKQVKMEYLWPNQHLVFITGQNDTLNILELKAGSKVHRIAATPGQIIERCYSLQDNRHVVFITQDRLSKVTSLNLLNLKTYQIRTFEDVFPESFISHSNGKHLTFLQNSAKDTKTLKLLNLETYEEFPLGEVKVETKVNYSLDDQFLYFFSNFDRDTRFGTLNVIKLDGTYPRFTAENVILNSCWYSPDSSYLAFLTNSDGVSATLNLLSLGGAFQKSQEKIAFRSNLNMRNIYSFSPNGQYVQYFITLKNGTTALKVIDLRSQQKQIFENAFFGQFSSDFSPDSKHLIFYTRSSEGDFGLKLLVLDKNFQEHPFSNAHRERNRTNSLTYDFSENSDYLVFFSKVTNDTGMLNILNLNSLRRDSIKGAYAAESKYAYSNTSQYVTFFTKPFRRGYPESGTINLLNLTNYKIYSYENVDLVKGFKYSPDDRFFAFFKDDQKTVVLVDVSTGKILHEIHHQYESIEDSFEFLNKDYFLTSTTHPVTQNKIYKLINLNHLGQSPQDYWKYLTTKVYPH